MSLIQHNLRNFLHHETSRYLSQQVGLSHPIFLSTLDTAFAFLPRLVERADTFNYYALANIFTRNGRETNTPEKIISTIQLGQRHEAITDARNLLNILLRDEQEYFHRLISEKYAINMKQAEQVVFIAAVFVNVILGQLMINNKMNMRAITRAIKAEANDLNEKMSADMRELTRKLSSGNTAIDESKVFRGERKNNNMLYAGLFAGLIIILSVIFKACTGTMH
ncbi:MAG: hypothetical protein FGM54_02185 [Chitinophagaceae bacterium]|nr:hypothetical protein [Chitinophagaceae bacterium]